jgi:16S rRNA (guanine527-N7)-methyltransferase
MTITDDKITQLLAPYGFVPSDSFRDRMRTYISMLLRWNQRISLTTVTDPVEVIRFHFGESLFALSAVPIGDGRLADVGSGAGFPGLPLAMANVDLHVTLIESDTKKATFLSEVVRELDLTNVRVARVRMEELPRDQCCFDFIAARALGQHEKLLNWSAMVLSDTGKVVMWLGEADSAKTSKEPDWQWATALRIPDSERRFLLAGSRG